MILNYFYKRVLIMYKSKIIYAIIIFYCFWIFFPSILCEISLLGIFESEWRLYLSDFGVKVHNQA